jgi:hypothetical protein
MHANGSKSVDYPLNASSNRYALSIFWILAAVAVIIGTLHAFSLAFVNDDAFISFRYAENLVRGNGLVYNAGERVEGYTNFLWTILIALGSLITADPVSLSEFLGITFFISSIILFIYLSWKLPSEGNILLFSIPLTSIALVLHRDFCVYATSGLETSMFTFFISATFATLIMARSNRGLMFSGLMVVLTMLTRPDGIIFLIASVVFITIMYRKPIVSILVFLLPSIFLFIPYWIWRCSYYGYFFPNTFYAKSIDVPYYSQGFEYLSIYFQVYYVFIIIAVLSIVALWKNLKNIFPLRNQSAFIELLRENRIVSHHILLAVLFCVTYMFFIVRIGGDFMHARLLIPITPMFYSIGEHLIKRLFKSRVYLIAAALILITTIFRNDIYKNNLNVGYVVDESRFYTTAQNQRALIEGKTLRRYLHELPVRMAFGPAYLKTAYYSDLPFALETSTGLTDTFLSHQILNTRGRPGHEKPAPMDYLRQRKIHFYIGPQLSLPEGDIPLNAIVFDTLLAQIITYDETLMSQLLRHPEVRFNHIPSYIDNYIKQITEYPYAKIMQDYTYLKRFYFSYNADSTHENQFLNYLNSNKILP